MTHTMYISGPMTGIKDFNFPAFREAADWLRSEWGEGSNLRFVSPVELDEGEGFAPDPEATVLPLSQYQTFLERDLELIRSDEIFGVVVLPGWANSGGARREVAEAQRNGKPVYRLQVLKDQLEAGEKLDAWAYSLIGTSEITSLLASWESPPDEETRVVNETTGGEKAQKLARFSLIPPKPLWSVAEHFGRGAEKYEDRNWERGYDWNLSLDALERHINLYKQGNVLDTETQTPHLAAVVFHALALMEFQQTHPELNNIHPDLTGDQV